MGRFIVTALAVALAIPTVLVLPSLLYGGMSFEAFFGVGAITFVLSIIGGIIFGLPSFWLARRQQWNRSAWMMAAIGAIVGAIGAMLLSIAFWAGNLDLVIPSLAPWGVLGAVGGLVAALTWHWLHASDAEIDLHA